MEGGEEKWRKVTTEEEEEKPSRSLGPVREKTQTMMSLHLIADISGFHSAAAAIYELKISTTGEEEVVVVHDELINPLVLVFRRVDETAVFYGASCGALGSDVYFFGYKAWGGSSSDSTIPPACVFDMKTKEIRSNSNFKQRSDTPEASSLVMGVNGKVYLVDDAPPFKDEKFSTVPFESLDPATGSWTSLPPAPFHSSSFVKENPCYLLSGYAVLRNYIIVSLTNDIMILNSPRAVRTLFFSYNMSTGNWKSVYTTCSSQADVPYYHALKEKVRVIDDGPYYHAFKGKVGVIDDVIYVYSRDCYLIAYPPIEEVDRDDSDLSLHPPLMLEVEGFKAPPLPPRLRRSESMTVIGDRVLCLVQTGLAPVGNRLDVQYACITLVQVNEPMRIKTLTSSVCTLNVQDVGPVTLSCCSGLRPEEFSTTEHRGYTHYKHPARDVDPPALGAMMKDEDGMQSSVAEMETEEVTVSDVAEMETEEGDGVAVDWLDRSSPLWKPQLKPMGARHKIKSFWSKKCNKFLNHEFKHGTGIRGGV